MRGMASSPRPLGRIQTHQDIYQEQGLSRYRYLPTIDAGGGGLWDPQGMLISTGAERLLGPI